MRAWPSTCVLPASMDGPVQHEVEKGVQGIDVSVRAIRRQLPGLRVRRAGQLTRRTRRRGAVRASPRTGLPFMLLRGAVYGATLVPLIFLDGIQENTLYTSPLVALIGVGGTWCLLLRHPQVPQRQRLLYAGVVGLLLAQIAWAMWYWPFDARIGGATRWLAFYVLVGISEDAVSGELALRVTIEYAVVFGVGILLIFLSTFARS